MRPKGKLLALVAMFAAVGLITATGAFTTVEAERTAEVDVTGDASALLALDEPDDMPAGSVTGASDGGATIDLSNDALESAQGLNPDATTELAPLLNITNNGENTVTVNVTVDGISDEEGNVEESDVEVSIIDANGGDFEDTDLDSAGIAQFGLRIDIQTEDIADEDFDIDITISADSSEAES